MTIEKGDSPSTDERYPDDRSDMPESDERSDPESDRSSDTYEDISPNQHFEPLRYVLLNRNLASVVPSMISH